MLNKINDKEKSNNAKNVEKQLKKDNLIKLGELSIAGAVLAGLHVTNNTSESVKAAISNGNVETNKDRQTLDSNTLTRMMNENIVQNSADTAKTTIASENTATNSATQIDANTDNGGFDEKTWGKLNASDWQGHVDGDYFVLDKYTGDPYHVIVPNAVDLQKVGIDTQGKQVGVTSTFMHDIYMKLYQHKDGASIAFSKTDGHKIKAIDSNWTCSFSGGDPTYSSIRYYLTKFDGNNLDTSNITDMNCMFSRDQLSDLNGLENWDTSHVTDMSNMFDRNNISDLTPLKDWNTSKVTDMNEMFWGNKISDLTPLTNWNTSKVTDMSQMFDENQISNLTPLKSWNVSNVTDMSNMFSDNKITDLTPLKNWNVSNVTDMYSIFRDNQISNLTPLKDWNVSNVTDMSIMFSDNKITDLTPLKGWNTNKVTNMESMFCANKISDLTPLKDWNVSNVTNMYSMFCDNQISNLAGLKDWNVSNVTDMRNMFGTNKKISDLTPLKDWNVSNVTNMYSMFCDNNISDLTPLTNWNTSKVTDMSQMFDENQISNLAGLKDWNTSKVTDMNEMFWGNKISDLTPLKGWNTSKVTNMSQMFEGNKLSNLAGLKNWDTSKVTDMTEMLSENKISDLTPLKDWDTSHVTNMYMMFMNNNQISDLTPLKDWNTSNVINMGCMFANDLRIKKADISKWDFSKISDSGLDGFIDSNYHTLINLGDNNTLPKWFMQSKVNGHRNDNVFTYGDIQGLIILTSNPNLLKHNIDQDPQSNYYNYLRFVINQDDGSSINANAWTPTFINSTPDKILQDAKAIRQQTLERVYKHYPTSQYIYTLTSDDENDPVNILTASYNISKRHTIKVQFKDIDTNQLLDTDTQTLTEPDDSSQSINYNNINSTIDKLKQAGYDASNITNELPESILGQSWNSLNVYNNSTDVYSLTNDNGNITLTYNVPHTHTKVAHDDPKSTSDLIPNTNKYFPTGLTKDDLNDKYTRTIKVLDQDTNQTLIPDVLQELNPYRDATVDDVTGQVTYSDWTKADLPKISIPAIKGYHFVNSTASSDAMNKNFIVTLYAAKDIEKDAIVVSDDNDSSNPVNIAQDTADTVYGNKIQFATDPKDLIKKYEKLGYKFVSSDWQDGLTAEPTTNNATRTFTIHLIHQKLNVTHDAPKSDTDVIANTTVHYPKGVAKDDLNKSVTIAIKYYNENDPNKNEYLSKDDQVKNIYRDAVIDAVTGQVTYGDWQGDSKISLTAPHGYTINGTHTVLPSLPGYIMSLPKSDYQQITIQLPKPKYILTYALHGINVVCFGNDTPATITVKDSQGNDLPQYAAQTHGHYGSTIDWNGQSTSDKINSIVKQMKTDGYNVDIDSLNPDQFKDVKYSDNTEAKPIVTITGEARDIKVTHDAPKSTSDVIQGTNRHYPAGIDQDDLNKDITRTITFKDENGKDLHVPIIQTVHLYRDATLNAVTGAVHYSDWLSDGSFNNVKVPTVTGYTPDKTAIDAVQSPELSKDYNQAVVYTRNTEPASITYVDDTTGKQLKVDTASSKFGDTIKFTTNPDDYIKQLKAVGYDLVSNNYKADAKASDNADNNKFTVHVKEHQIKVTHDTPKSTDDTIEGTNQHYPKGLTKDDLNQTLTRTVTFKDENGKAMHDPVIQTVHATRDAIVNAVTGQVTYTDWTDDGSFDSIAIPKFDGYTADTDKIDKVDTPKVGTDYNKAVLYTRNDEDASITYIDDTTGKVLKNDQIKPKFGDTIKFSTDPANYIKQLEDMGYKLVSNDYKADATAKTDPAQNKFTVHVKQGLIEVTHNAPKTANDVIDGTTVHYPDNVGQDNLNHTATRTIKFEDSDGNALHDPVVQSAHIYRDATVNAVTGETQYTTWTSDDSFAAVKVPDIEGYTSFIKNVPALDKLTSIGDRGQKIIYNRAVENASIKYIDDTTGDVLKSENAQLQYKDEIKFNPADYIKRLQDKGYELVSNNFKDGTTASADPTKNAFEVHVKQRNITVTHDAPKTTDDTIENSAQHYPKGVSQDDLNKTVTRTVVLKDENGKDLHDPIVQRVQMHRDATVNAVTGDVTYTKWSNEDSFDEVKIPDIDGYTPNKTSIPAETPDSPSNEDTNVTYTRNTEQASIKYVDDTTGKTLKTENATPKFGDTIQFTTNPADYIKELQLQGYALVSNNYKSDTKASSDASKNQFEVHVKQQSVKVTHDQPKSTTDAINGTTKYYPAGVNKDDLNKTISRTIILKDTDGKTLHDPIVQKVELHRDATVNVVTGEVQYTPWTTDGSFDAVQVPSVDGYTADKTQIDGVKNPKDGQTYDTSVVYTRNDEDVSITYIDDTTGKVLKNETAKPKYGDVIKFDTTPADYIKSLEAQGYKVISNDYKDGATAQTDPTKNKFTVHVQQRNIQVVHDDPKTTDDTISGTLKKYPKGVDKNSLNETISRTIVLKDENGKALHEPIVQKVHMHRNATVNATTGVVTYTPWTAEGSFDAVQVPSVDGYTADKTVIDKVENPQDGQDYNTSVVYSRNDEDASITYIDDTTGKVLKNETTKPKFGDAITFKTTPSDYIKQLQSQGYELVSNDYDTNSKASTDPAQNKFTVHVKQRNIQVTHDNPKTTDDTIENTTQHYPKGVDKDDLNKSVTRTITIKDSDGKVLGKPIVQTVKMHRDATVNATTGEVTYTDWSNEGSFDSVKVPDIDGYTPDKTEIAGVKDPKNDQTYDTNITYTRNDENASISYIDDTAGKVLKTDTAKLKYGDAIKFETDPADYIKQLQDKGYEAVSNNFKSDVTASTDPAKNEFAIHVKQRTLKVMYDNPKTTDDTVEGTTQHYPKGVDKDDLNKTISRTIVLKDSDGNAIGNPIVQTVHMYRDATVNATTGNVTYTDWGSDDSFDAVPVPKKDGYTADKTEIPAVKNPEVDQKYDTNVTYTRNSEKASISYIDDTTGQTIKTDIADLKYDDAIKFESDPNDYIKQLESQGYVLVSNDYKNDAKASTNPDNNKFTVHVKEVSAKVTYDNPKSVTDLVDDTKVHYPAGVDKDDLNKTISRTIVLKDPDGKVVGKPIVQTVKVHRDATVNVVTGKVTYTDWTNEGSFDSVPVPKVDGYTPDKTEIAGVKDPKVDQDYNTSIIYTRDDENASITYVDDTTGNVLKNESVKPKFGDEIKFETAPSDYIDQLKKQGYDIVSNNFKDGTTASTDPTKNKFTVHVKHHLSKVERTKDVHENINYNVTDENGKTNSETDKNSPVLHFTQSGVKDEVTGKTDWNGTLNSQTFTTINTAKKPGYKADVNTIPSKTIMITNGNWNKNHDINVTVSYKPEKETVKLVIKDGNGNIVKTITKTGNYGDSYDFSGTKAPEIDGYTFVKASGNAQGKFGEDDNNVVLVYKKNNEENKGNENRGNNGSNNHGNDNQRHHENQGNQNNHENNVNNSNHSNNNTNNQGNQTNTNTSSNDAETNVFKQNLAKQQNNTLPEMSEAKKDQALIGVGVASLLGLAGIAGVQINKRRHGKH